MEEKELWYRCKVLGDKQACKTLAGLTIERRWLKVKATVDFMDGCPVEIRRGWRGIEIERYNEKCDQTQIEASKEMVEENNIKPRLKEILEDLKELRPVIETGSYVASLLLNII